MIFDVKMDLTQKAHFVAGGYLTDTLASITYSSVVSRDSVCLAFLIAALNDLDIMACGAGNAYLMHHIVKRFGLSPAQSFDRVKGW